MHRYFWISLFASPDGVLWYPDEGGAAGAAGTGGAAAAGGTTAPPAGTTTAQPAGAAPAGGTAAAAGAGKFTYEEDRSAWVPPDKFKGAEGLNNRLSSELDKLKTQLADRDRRIAALAGVTVPSPEQAESQRIADAFFALPQFAHLRGITPEFLQNVNALLSQGATFAEARDHVYNQQADRFLSSLDTAFAAEIGAEKLTPGQSKKLRSAFASIIPDAKTDPEAHAAFNKRYDSGDLSLIDEFVKEYAADMLEPARRQATVPVALRRPVPRGGPSAAVTTQANKPDYSKMSVREMLDAAEKDAEAVGR